MCCGDRHDAELLLAASSRGLTIDELNPIWLRTPLAPFPAALIERVDIDTVRLQTQYAELATRFDLVVVEGVGGWKVPIRKDYFVSDLAREMDLPLLVVALNRLGCLNHTMLTIESIVREGLHCAGVVLNTLPEGVADSASVSNRETLRQITDVPILENLAEDMTEFPPEWRLTLGFSQRV